MKTIKNHYNIVFFCIIQEYEYSNCSITIPASDYFQLEVYIKIPF